MPKRDSETVFLPSETVFLPSETVFLPSETVLLPPTRLTRPSNEYIDVQAPESPKYLEVQAAGEEVKRDVARYFSPVYASPLRKQSPEWIDRPLPNAINVQDLRRKAEMRLRAEERLRAEAAEERLRAQEAEERLRAEAAEERLRAERLRAEAAAQVADIDGADNGMPRYAVAAPSRNWNFGFGQPQNTHLRFGTPQNEHLRFGTPQSPEAALPGRITTAAQAKTAAPFAAAQPKRSFKDVVAAARRTIQAKGADRNAAARFSTPPVSSRTRSAHNKAAAQGPKSYFKPEPRTGKGFFEANRPQPAQVAQAANIAAAAPVPSAPPRAAVVAQARQQRAAQQAAAVPQPVAAPQPVRRKSGRASVKPNFYTP
jgi:hypothetical protein